MKRIRKPNRHLSHDYNQPGYYYVTICTKGYIEFFGSVIGRIINLSTSGSIVKDCWVQIPEKNRCVDIDIFQIMPNHIHGIIIVKDNPGYTEIVRIDEAPRNIYNKYRREMLLPKIVGSFKASTSRQIKHVCDNSFTWQRSYYDNVVKSEKALISIRDYIRNNPLQWELDRNNPKNLGKNISKR